jgi:hypothetical protein
MTASQHWKHVLTIVDSFRPTAEVRAEVLRMLNPDALIAWSDRLRAAVEAHRQRDSARQALEAAVSALDDMGALAWLGVSSASRVRLQELRQDLPGLLENLTPRTSPPRLNRKKALQSAVCRAWEELTGEQPPRSDPYSDINKDRRFFELVEHPAGAHGMGALDSRRVVRDYLKREEEIKRQCNPDFIRLRDEVRAALGETREVRPPRRGRKRRN